MPSMSLPLNPKDSCNFITAALVPGPNEPSILDLPLELNSLKNPLLINSHCNHLTPTPLLPWRNVTVGMV